jgi:hypothetical protein
VPSAAGARSGDGVAAEWEVQAARWPVNGGRAPWEEGSGFQRRKGGGGGTGERKGARKCRNGLDALGAFLRIRQKTVPASFASERSRKDDAAQFLKQRDPAGMHATIRG